MTSHEEFLQLWNLKESELLLTVDTLEKEWDTHRKVSGEDCNSSWCSFALLEGRQSKVASLEKHIHSWKDWVLPTLRYDAARRCVHYWAAWHAIQKSWTAKSHDGKIETLRSMQYLQRCHLKISFSVRFLAIIIMSSSSSIIHQKSSIINHHYHDHHKS